MTALMVTSASMASIGILNMILDTGANLEIKCKDGSTALHFAAGHGNSKKVERLIEVGAGVNVTRKDKETPLMLASARNGNEYTNIIEMLINAGADVNKRDISKIHL